jgi:hypothetical protein
MLFLFLYKLIKQNLKFKKKVDFTTNACNLQS